MMKKVTHTSPRAFDHFTGHFQIVAVSFIHIYLVCFCNRWGLAHSARVVGLVIEYV